MPVAEKKQAKIKVTYAFDNQVCRIALNSARGNILDRAMMSEIYHALVTLKDQPSCKLIVFSGEGKHFSFGASVPEHSKDQVKGLLKEFHELFYRLIDLAIPTLSIVRGQCLGGAMELACFSNFIFADATAIFAVPEIKLGVFPPPASVFLPLKIGQSWADRLILTGMTLTVEKAKEIGLVNQINSPEELEKGVADFIEQEILPQSASSLRYAVKASRWTFNQTFKSHCQELETFFLEKLMASHDANEGIEAFMDKRQPHWKNC